MSLQSWPPADALNQYQVFQHEFSEIYSLQRQFFRPQPAFMKGALMSGMKNKYDKMIERLSALLVARCKCLNCDEDLKGLPDRNSVHSRALDPTPYNMFHDAVQFYSNKVEHLGWKELCDLMHRFHCAEGDYLRGVRGSQCCDTVCRQRGTKVVYRSSVP